MHSTGLAVRNVAAKSVLTKSNLPVSDYSANPYTGCEHSCRYCYASFMKRFTNVPAIIDRAKNQCNLVWLENLNLRGNYRTVIMNWIHENYPELYRLYHEIYTAKNLSYWYELDEVMRDYCRKNSLPYVRNDDSMKRPFDAPPVVVNYFFHSEIVKRKKNSPCR